MSPAVELGALIHDALENAAKQRMQRAIGKNAALGMVYGGSITGRMSSGKGPFLLQVPKKTSRVRSTEAKLRRALGAIGDARQQRFNALMNLLDTYDGFMSVQHRVPFYREQEFRAKRIPFKDGHKFIRISVCPNVPGASSIVIEEDVVVFPSEACHAKLALLEVSGALRKRPTPWILPNNDLVYGGSLNSYSYQTTPRSMRKGVTNTVTVMDEVNSIYDNMVHAIEQIILHGKTP